MDSLAISDVRAIVRLLGEVIGMQGSVRDRKRHLVEGLARLIDADVWMWVQNGNFAPGQLPLPISVIDGGYASDEQKRLFFECVTHPDGTILTGPVIEQVVQHGHVTRTRRDIVPSDDQWYRSPIYI